MPSWEVHVAECSERQACTTLWPVLLGTRIGNRLLEIIKWPLPSSHSVVARGGVIRAAKPAKLLVMSVRPLYVSPSSTPTTRFRVSLATLL